MKWFLDYVKRFATEEALRDQEKNDQSSDESSMSSMSDEDEVQYKNHLVKINNVLLFLLLIDQRHGVITMELQKY